MQESPLNQEAVQDDRGDVKPGDGTEADSGSTRETMPSVEELLRKAELQAQEHHDAWLRAKAETENIRRRAQVDVANAHKFGVESFASALPQSGASSTTWYSGCICMTSTAMEPWRETTRSAPGP